MYKIKKCLFTQNKLILVIGNLEYMQGSNRFKSKFSEHVKMSLAKKIYILQMLIMFLDKHTVCCIVFAYTCYTKFGKCCFNFCFACVV